MGHPTDKYLRVNVPRYTSYPTAPHFSNAIGSEDYAKWLSELDPNQSVSLYLHVPFCRQLCWYCGCNMKLAKKDAPIASYAATLMDEVRLLAKHLPGRMRISHLHWGGGTPTALQSDDLQAVMDVVRTHFEIEDGAELAIESDPRTLKPDMITQIGQMGFTRASFGVQEFDPKVQKAINRIQPPGMVRACVAALRQSGVADINFDLIYGLPHQTADTLLETIRLCVEIKPARIALFGYAHVPWMAKKQRLIDEAALPGPAARLQQAQAAAKALTDAGYVAIGLDHFALPDDDMAIAAAKKTLRRNFQGYTTDQAETILGVGSTSIGRTPSGYVQNIAETGAWARSILQGQLPIGKGLAFINEDALRGYVIERLMCCGDVDLRAAAAQFHAAPNWYDMHKEALFDLQVDGLIRFQGGCVTVTEDGQQVVRVIASTFDAYLAASAARHAVAV